MTTKAIFGFAIANLGMAHAAFGEDAKATTGAENLKLGAEFRAEINRDDEGFMKSDEAGAKTPTAMTKMQVQAINLKFDGHINPSTEYHFRFNLLGGDPNTGMPISPFDYGYGTHKFTDMIGFSMGRMPVLQGGWDANETQMRGFADHWQGAYIEHQAFSNFDNALQFNLHAAGLGSVHLQLLNDKMVDATCETKTPDAGCTFVPVSYNKTAHPTFALGWFGKFGPIAPVVEYTTWDNQKSRSIDVGAKLEMAGLDARLDIISDSFMKPVKSGTDSKPSDKADTGMGETLKVSYKIPHTAEPFFYYSTYSVTENGDDVKGNAGFDPKTGAAIFNDNKSVLSLGTNLDMLGKGFTPFVAYEMISGTFFKAGTTDTESKSDSQLRIGVLGEF